MYLKKGQKEQSSNSRQGGYNNELVPAHERLFISSERTLLLDREDRADRIDVCVIF